MARPTIKIKCRICKRNIDAIIVKDYGLPDKKNLDQTNLFRKLLIKDHRRSIWYSKHCSNSGRRFTKRNGTYDVQS